MSTLPLASQAWSNSWPREMFGHFEFGDAVVRAGDRLVMNYVHFSVLAQAVSE